MIDSTIWSLWAVLEFNADVFYLAVSTLRRNQTLIEANRSGVSKDIPISDEVTLKNFTLMVESLGIDAAVLGAEVTGLALKEFHQELKSGQCTYLKAAKRIEDIDTCLKRQLSLTKLFVMNRARSHYYDKAELLFDDKIVGKFPEAIDDMEGAGRCLALAEGTASVLHLMRVMEVGLRKLAGILGIPYAPSWESYLKQISDQIGAKHNTKTADWKARKTFFRDISGDLLTVKQVWRNPTMHVGRKYSPDEAEEVFRAVKSFLNRLSVGV